MNILLSRIPGAQALFKRKPEEPKTIPDGLPSGETRPRLATNPLSKLSSDYLKQPLETDTGINEQTPALRPLQPYALTEKGQFGDTVVPMGVGENHSTRPRLALPVDSLKRAQENYDASMSSQPYFGQYSKSEDGHDVGDLKPHADRGIGGRTLAFLKRAGKGLLRGDGAISSLAEGTEAAINPDLNAVDRLHETQGGNQRELGNQIVLRGEQAKIGQVQANTDYLRQRPDLEQQRIAQGNRRLTQQDVNGERQAVLAALKTRPTLDAQRDADLIARARKAGVEVDPDNYGKQSRGIWIEGVYSDPYTGSPILRDGKQIVDRTKIPVEYDGYMVSPGTAVTANATAGNRATIQSEKGVEDSNRINDITDNNAVIDSQIAGRQPDLDAAKRELNALEQASKAVSMTGVVVDDSKRLERARKKVRDLQNEIDTLERQKKVVPQPRVSASRSMPKLSEQSIRDAATKAGLDPNIAVQRAKARGQL